jgi:hypothetical protein
MSPTYYIYSTRAQGWVNRGGTYGTQLDEAKEFGRDEAMAYCQRVNNADALPIAIPVETSVAQSAGFSK